MIEVVGRMRFFFFFFSFITKAWAGVINKGEESVVKVGGRQEGGEF